MANKIIITWDDSNTNISIEGEKPMPTSSLLGVLEYAKLMLFEKREKSNEL